MKMLRGWMVAGCTAMAVLSGGAIAAVVLGSSAVGTSLVVGMLLLFLLLSWMLHHQAGVAVRVEKETAEKTRAQERNRDRASMLAFIDSVPHAVASLLPNGTVEIANARAATFGLEPGKNAGAASEAWLRDIVNRAVMTRDRVTPTAGTGLIQHFEEGRESFFMPQAIPIINGKGELEGVTVVLVDVTATRQAHETRSNFMSTFSHELKTPMTSLQMSIYLLLDDAADRLTPRQLDLLKAAREDADRLHRLMEEVLSAARAKA